MNSSELYVDIIDSAEIQSDTVNIILGSNGLGIVFRNIHEFYKAKQYFDQALDLCKAINDEYCYSVTYKNLGTYYFYLKNYEKALKLSTDAATRIRISKRLRKLNTRPH